MDNELIIDKKTNLLAITHRRKYTKLTLKKVINPSLLIGFTNVKELIIESPIEFSNWINETNINKFPFISNLEILRYKNIGIYGKDYDSKKQKTYKLNAPNLKVIEFPDHISEIRENYISALKNLEQIIFNVSLNTYHYRNINTINTNLKEIIIKTKYNTYNIPLDYLPHHITCIRFFDEEQYIYLSYGNNHYHTTCKIKNDKISIDNQLSIISDDLINDNNCLYIPDIVNSIYINNSNFMKIIKKISLNTKILKHKEYQRILKGNKLEFLEKITLRNDNEMSLFKNKEFNIKDYGILKEISIEDNKLCLEYDNFIIKIDESGKIEKEEIIDEKESIDQINGVKIRNKNEETTSKGARVYDDRNNLNNYTSKQLEYYSYYKKLLELLPSTEKELNEAMSIVEDNLVKILKLNKEED